MRTPADSSDSSQPGAPQRHRHARVLRWVLAVLAGLLALLALAVVLVATFDWNRVKPWVNDKVSEATGRRFAIEGDLSARWHWPQPLETGWRRWVPGVTVQAQQLSLDNPEGFIVVQAPDQSAPDLPALPAKPAPQGDQPAPADQKADEETTAPPALPGSAASEAQTKAAHALALESSNDPQAAPPPRPPQGMGTIASASATMRLLPLLSRTLVLDTLVLTAPDIALARRKDGSNNWTFANRKQGQEKSEHDNPWDLRVDQLIIRGGWLGYVDGAKDLALRARVDTLARGDEQSEDGRYGVHVLLTGSYGKARIEGEGVGGPVLTLREKKLRYPLRVSARSGSVQVQAEGLLDNPAALSGMDLQLQVHARSMADLFPLTGLVLPNTPPLQIKGRLLGSLEPEKAVWEYRDFNGTVGDSDLHGSVTYTSGKPRPKLQGHMTSKLLRLADLGPVLGAPSGKRPREKGTDKRPGKVLPNAHFATDRWGAMDLDLAFAGEKIVRPEALPLDRLSVRAVLDDRQLHLTPLRFGVAQGRIDSDVLLDGRAKPLRAQLKGSVQGLQLSALFPKVELMKKSFGRLDGSLQLAGRGDSIAAMLASSDGGIRLYIRDGTFSKEMLDLAALNLGSVVVSKLFGENKEIKLRCAVADLRVKDGMADAHRVRLNTEEAIVDVTGLLDLGEEEMSLRIKPESLKWKFFSLRTPLYVRGTFAQPQVGVEPGPLVLRAGAAVAAAAIAPAALALVPITVPGAEDDANCAKLLAPSADDK
ncbi:AsmA family protein [Pulveribacter sp.]|uniref:AsmA family protein n=1 Tax=Pulveribacter sp. TaxID=2678893 RepID=UPI0028AC6E00|nr:AsmA family protein [Pulveribacter sp.]